MGLGQLAHRAHRLGRGHCQRAGGRAGPHLRGRRLGAQSHFRLDLLDQVEEMIEERVEQLCAQT
jgi:hypothetical protein